MNVVLTLFYKKNCIPEVFFNYFGHKQRNAKIRKQ